MQLQVVHAAIHMRNALLDQQLSSAHLQNLVAGLSNYLRHFYCHPKIPCGVFKLSNLDPPPPPNVERNIGAWKVRKARQAVTLCGKFMVENNTIKTIDHLCIANYMAQVENCIHSYIQELVTLGVQLHMHASTHA